MAEYYHVHLSVQQRKPPYLLYGDAFLLKNNNSRCVWIWEVQFVVFVRADCEHILNSEVTAYHGSRYRQFS